MRLGTDRYLNIHKLQSIQSDVLVCFGSSTTDPLTTSLPVVRQPKIMQSGSPSAKMHTELIIIMIADTLIHKQAESAKQNYLNLLSLAGKSKKSILLLNCCQNTKIVSELFI